MVAKEILSKIELYGLKLIGQVNNVLENLGNRAKLYHILIPVGLQTISGLLIKHIALTLDISNISFFLLISVAIVLFIIATRTILWFILLKKFPLSVMYPFAGLNLVLFMIFGWLIFGEPVTLANIIGSIFIIGGISMIYIKS